MSVLRKQLPARLATATFALCAGVLWPSLLRAQTGILTAVVNGGEPTVISGAYATIAKTNIVDLSGTNSLPGSTRVTINGAEVDYDPAAGHWSARQSLTPGMNRLFVAALDTAGALLASTNLNVVSEVSGFSTGGVMLGDTVWSRELGVVRVTNTVTVADGATLTIGEGVVVLLTPQASIRAGANGGVTTAGTDADPVFFLPADGDTPWLELAADGANAQLTLRHVDIGGGTVQFRDGSTGWMEDTYVHDYLPPGSTTPIAGCDHAASVTVRRCHFSRYHETLWRFTPMLIEDSLFEHAVNPSSDALDFDAAPPGSVIRRCTFRHGPQTNTDAVDIGAFGGVGSSGVLIEDCLLYDFNDKGISIGESAQGITVRNCLIHHVTRGVQVKDVCTASVGNCTIADSAIGLHGYEKFPNTGGGRLTNTFNNILWNNTTALVTEPSTVLIVNYSDTGGANWPGTGNFNADPLFMASALYDYRLRTNSPCLGAGREGGNLGVRFPVGAPMARSHPVIESVTVSQGSARVSFWCDPEKSYALQTSPDLVTGPWITLTNTPGPPLPRLVQVDDALANRSRFYRLLAY